MRGEMNVIRNPISPRSRFACYGKKGIGVVVVSVLIILITVAALVITWYWVVPWINDMETSQDTNANLRIVLEGYTAYDADHEMAFVQIKRGADDSTPVAMDVIFNVEGNTYIFRTEDIPGNNQVALYYFNFSKEGIVGVPQFVKVAAIFSSGVSGIAMGDAAILEREVKVDNWDEVRIKAEKNTLRRPSDSSSPGEVPAEIIDEPVSVCKDDFVNGEVYVMNKSYSLTSGATCFLITANNVIVDMDRYLILGNYSGIGVHIKGKNVTVKNGRIENFEKGVWIDGSGATNDAKILHNEFFDNNHSVYVDVSFGNLISGNNMTDGNYSNIYLDNAGTNHVTNNLACGSKYDIFCGGISSDSSSGNFGTGNTFDVVEFCPGSWLGGAGAYAICPIV